MNTVGERIREARQDREMTQAELAKRLGVAYQNIGQWESGKRIPKVETLMKIGKALSVPWVWFTRPDLFENNLEKAQTEYNMATEQNRAHKAFFSVLEGIYGKSTEHIIHGEHSDERYWVYDNSGDPFALMSDDISIMANLVRSMTKTLVDRFAITEEEAMEQIKKIQSEEAIIMAKRREDDFTGDRGREQVGPSANSNPDEKEDTPEE